MHAVDQELWQRSIPEEEWTGNQPPGRSGASKLPKFGVSLLVVAGIFTGGGGTTQASPVREPQAWCGYVGDRTSNRRVMQAPAAPTGVTHASQDIGKVEALRTQGAAAMSTKDAVRWLHESSGLTWDQLGRVFGVSRRAVHMWASGSRMNASNVETLHELIAVVQQLGADTPEERRSALLAADADGLSLVDRFRSRHRSGPGDVSGAMESPDFYLGAQHGDVARQ